jgi:hypothetical protein
MNRYQLLAAEIFGYSYDITRTTSASTFATIN